MKSNKTSFYSLVVVLITRKIFLYFLLFYVGTVSANSKHPVLKGAWQQKFPYQYLATPVEFESLTGLDIELQKMIFEDAGYETNLVYMSKEQHLYSMKEGTIDFAMGVYKTEELARYYNFSKPYRYEESAIFFRKEDNSKHSYKSISHLINAVKEHQYKVGVIKGYRYASKELNDFVTDLKNQPHLVFVVEDVYNIALLLKDKIDIFIADKIVASNYIARSDLGSKISSYGIGIKSPIHFMFNKDKFDTKKIEKIDMAIHRVSLKESYQQAILSAVFPVWVLNIVESNWFMLLKIVGVVAFVFSGLFLSYLNHTSLLGTIIYCSLPALGGFFVKDLILGRFPVTFVESDSVLILVFLMVLIGFFIGKMINIAEHTMAYVDEKAKNDKLKMTSSIFDSIGLSCFAAIGFLSVFIHKMNALYLVGPLFAFITGALGCAFRDLLSKSSLSEIAYGRIYSEFSILLGAIFASYFYWHKNDLEITEFRNFILGAVILNIIVMVTFVILKIDNIRFVQKEPHKKKIYSYQKY